jgi:hypothetical protein
MAAEPPTETAAPKGAPPADVQAGDPHPHHRQHRVLVGVLLGLGCLVGLLATFSLWINRQALNTDNWVKTSSHLIGDPKVDDALGNYLVAQLFANVNVSGEIQGLLPKDIQGLAGPAAGGLRELADQVAPQLLASSQVQNAWRQANLVAHKELLHIINGGGNTVSTKNGEVTLNLNIIIDQLAQQLGLSSQLAAARSKLQQGGTQAQIQQQAQQRLGITLPDNIGQLTIIKSQNLKTAQDIASAIRGLALWLTILTVALFALAVWLARGWRRVALRSAGWCLVGVGVLVVLLRRVLGHVIINHLIVAPSNRPAGLAAWDIATSLLYDIAAAAIVYGALLVIAAWLGGHTRAAVAVRRAIAPEMRIHPVAVAGGIGGVYLLILIWGPTPAFRQVLPILLMIALISFGFYLLRQQTMLEFPDAQMGDAAHRMRGWWDEHRPGRSGHHAATGGSGAGVADLERLSDLHERGKLTDEEFAAAKSQITGRS